MNLLLNEESQMLMRAATIASIAYVIVTRCTKQIKKKRVIRKTQRIGAELCELIRKTGLSTVSMIGGIAFGALYIDKYYLSVASNDIEGK